jgi:flagellar hook-associated protein 1
MSLNIALLNAISGLQVNSRALDVTAQNVSNVNTEGYSRKTIHQQAVVVAGQGAGVEISAITRTVNEFMIKELRTSVTELGDAQVRSNFYARMQDLFGSLSSDTSPSLAIADLATKFQALSDTPENVSLRTDVVERARLLVEQVADMAAQIESLRVEVDREIQDDVTSVNTQLSLIQELNIQIAEGSALGQGVSELQDQRDIALNKVAEVMDIQQFSRGNGEIVILTKLGRPLVDRTAATISHTSVSSINPLTTHTSGAIDGITLNGIDITNEISSGRVAGLVAMRDTLLPNLHSQMQELVGALHNEINALHNQGTAHPGLTTVTGTRTVASTDVPIWTGTFRVAANDSSGTIVELLDINLATTTTIGDLVTAIDGMTNASASLNASGKLVITGAGANKIAFGEMSSAVTAGSETKGASNFLGLNDFFTSATEYDDYQTAFLSSNSAALGIAGSLTFHQASFGTTAVAYTTGNSLADLATSINANATLSTAGITASVIADGTGYRLRVSDNGADNFFVTDSSTFVSSRSLQPRDSGIVSQVAVRSDIVSDPSKISRGTLNSSLTAVATDLGIAIGDKSAVQAMANQFNEKLDFDATNLLAASSSTLSQYASEILSLNAAQANSANDTRDARQILFDSLREKTSAISGVNLDEEMSLMIVLENAYAASARVVSATQEMFDLLTQMVR